VLDPFAGTGRALEVALGNGRNAIGFEAQKAFVDLAREKINGNEHPRQLRQ
jgi:DNA modification methylase